MAEKNKLTAVKIKAAPAGKLEDGGGLRLDKTGDGSGKWIFRYSFAGKRREMGLGNLRDVSLADARRARDKWAALILSGKDPISERERIRAEEEAALNKQDPTLAELFDLYFEAKKSELKGEGKAGRWMSPINLYILPKLGGRRISTLRQIDFKDALAPIWKAKPATARKAFTRTRQAFAAGRLMGFECDSFTLDAARHMLGKLNEAAVPMEATPWQEIPALWEALDDLAPSYLALRFGMLTVMRTESVIGARFSEISNGVWTIPKSRMKGRLGHTKDFSVPLSAAALEIVKRCAEISDDYLFPSSAPRGHISNAAYSKTMRDTGFPGTPHGFRTSFRTWVQDTQVTSYDIAETCLAHVIGGKVERAYARSDMLDQRRPIMEKWAAYVTGESAKIIPLRTVG